jgi:hypothetical protein
MTKSQAKPAIAAVNALFSQSPDGLREIVRAVMQEILEAEMTDALGAEKGERTSARLGYRSGYYTRTFRLDPEGQGDHRGALWPRLLPARTSRPASTRAPARSADHPGR